MDHVSILIAVTATAPAVLMLLPSPNRRGRVGSGPASAAISSALASGAIVAAVATVYWWLLQYSLNHDTSWYVVATRKWLGGAELYRDIVEINPPLAFYLTRPGLWIADQAGVGDKAGLLLFFCLVIGLSLLVVQRLLAEAALTAPQRHGMLAASALALLIAPIEEFGQRDHLMVVFALPYLMAQALRPMGLHISRTRGTLLAAFALPGLALKPYFLVLPACLTALEIWQRRSLRPVLSAENLTLALGVAGYLGFVALRHPLYLEEVVPLAAQVYDAYGFPAFDVIANPALVAMLLAALVRNSAALQGEARQTARALLVALLAFAVSYLVQFRGFRYQSFPVEGGAILLVAWVLASGYPILRHRPAPAIASVLALSLTVGTSLYHGPYRADYVPTLKAALPGLTNGQTIMVFSATVWLTFPFVQEVGAIWASRYPVQWMLPGAVTQLAQATCAASEDPCRTLQEMLDGARAAAIEDLILYNPRYVLVDMRKEKPYFDGVAFDFVDFLKGDPRFEKLWSNYRYIGSSLIFGIWVRE